ncbi:hypothetical protein [Glycomyces buryatensis]|uniref:Uncharacterized protein n=1 Tax=Glycomyces buryatensis TaxID=2570927 RepID=A0A4S8PVM6_9ACTN|nr:hypothetical protein [Glycomyces buryatensis]THV35633.1 hypothetical protein FAB82_22415 [Glycomyces buryatensis]
MRRWKSAASLAAAAAVLAAASACTPDESDQAGEEDEKVALVDLLNENERLRADVADAEYAVIKDCLEEQGHSVHDAHLFPAWTEEDGGLQDSWHDFDNWLPKPEVASEWGFGVGTVVSNEDYEEYEEVAYGVGGEEEEIAESTEEIDNSAFEALPAEERAAWYIAYEGEELSEFTVWTLEHPDATEDEIRAYDWTGLDEDNNPLKPGGCRLTMIEALYGEPELVPMGGFEDDPEMAAEMEASGEPMNEWSWGVDEPAVEVDSNAAYIEGTVEESQAFISCLSDGGWGDWEFDEWGSLPVNHYLSMVYQGEDYLEEEAAMYDPAELEDMGGLETPEGAPDLPVDLPTDDAGKVAHEIALAEAFVACSDETGFRDAAVEAWDNAELYAYRDAETELFAYQEELRAVIADAQKLL